MRRLPYPRLKQSKIRLTYVRLLIQTSHFTCAEVNAWILVDYYYITGNWQRTELNSSEFRDLNSTEFRDLNSKFESNAMPYWLNMKFDVWNERNWSSSNTFNYRQVQNAGHRSQVRSQGTGHRAQGTGHGSQVTGHRSQGTGHRAQKTQ